MEYLPYILLLITLFMVGMPLWTVLQARRQRGKPAPAYAALLSAEQLQAQSLLFYFYSEHCGPCRSLGPVVDELAARHGNIIKVDVMEQTELAREFAVRATPSFVLVRDGTIEAVHLGVLSPKKLEALLA